MTLEEFKDVYKDKTLLEKFRLMQVQHDYWRNDVKDRVDAHWRGNYEEARYYANECNAMADRVAWLMEEISSVMTKREPSLMDADEVKLCDTGTVIWVEEHQGVVWNLFPLVLDIVSTHPDTGTDYLFFITYHDLRKFEFDEYFKSWRCWTSRPTDAQREATPWN